VGRTSARAASRRRARNTEGDGRTPSGAYGFDFFFGVEPDPGVRFPYRSVTSNAIVWDDDPASRANEWVDRGRRRGRRPRTHVQHARTRRTGHRYNTARTPEAGSAIFLHVSTGRPTAGCVSLPASSLLAVLPWLDPSQQPRIVMGTTADVTS
jgi:L,D-peptidoglycan transpeptidase YkuD (ErfK/YbiS/YcfS/YnhG family)